MEIKRINTYADRRFSQHVLNQHGCFLVDGWDPYEVDIISGFEAVIRGSNREYYAQIIEEFRFYTPHITVFYDENRNLIRQYPEEPPISVPTDAIQPTQFFVDEDKVQAISTFIRKPADIVIQIVRNGDRILSADGHTRLYYAVKMGWTEVKAVETAVDDYLIEFAEEAIKRGIQSPKDLPLIPHAEYEEKWNKFCDDFFAKKQGE